MTTYVFQFFADSRATANSSPAQQWSLIRPACHEPSLLTVHAPDPNRPSHRVLEAPPGCFNPPEQQSQPDARQDRPQTRQRDKSRSRRRSRSRNQVRKHRDRTSRERRGRGRRDDRHAKRHRKRSRQGRCRSRSLPRQPTLPPNTPEPPGHPGHPRRPDLFTTMLHIQQPRKSLQMIRDRAHPKERRLLKTGSPFPARSPPSGSRDMKPGLLTNSALVHRSLRRTLLRNIPRQQGQNLMQTSLFEPQLTIGSRNSPRVVSLCLARRSLIRQSKTGFNAFFDDRQITCFPRTGCSR